MTEELWARVQACRGEPWQPCRLTAGSCPTRSARRYAPRTARQNRNVSQRMSASGRFATSR
jgi:hypothetical protein